MTNKNIEALNTVTKGLIDSHEGYKKAYEMTDENYGLRSEFIRRANEREQLVQQFQSQVRSFGGEPETSGGLLGSAHRSIMQFSSMFRDDEKAALGAIDDGEEYLADKIENCLNEKDLNDTQTRSLLQQAHSSAKQGERFAALRERATG